METFVPHEYRYYCADPELLSDWMPCRQFWIASPGMDCWVYVPLPEHSQYAYEVRVVGSE